MEVREVSAPLPAGEFSTWLRYMRRALRGERSSDVPCDSCTACCRSSQFVHIAPDETETLAHIPSALLFPTPRRPTGHVLLGHDEEGCCRRTCRTYDCRVFPASAVEIEDEEKALIAERAPTLAVRLPRRRRPTRTPGGAGRRPIPATSRGPAPCRNGPEGPDPTGRPGRGDGRPVSRNRQPIRPGRRPRCRCCPGSPGLPRPGDDRKADFGGLVAHHRCGFGFRRSGGLSVDSGAKEPGSVSHRARHHHRCHRTVGRRWTARTSSAFTGAHFGKVKRNIWVA